ncbi:hypothetical protein DB41_AX00040 [Neochlamydia sp. TUME1]|nr:hypothetical protein DB41_AX00040 [Neochlamydia sp. TUME1]
MPESLRRVYTIFNDLIKHPEVIRYVPQTIIIMFQLCTCHLSNVHQIALMHVGDQNLPLSTYRYIQSTNLDLSAQKQISPSNLYTATFCHMDTTERLTLLEFWSQHCEASGKKFSMLFQNKFAIMVTMLTQLTQASISRSSSRTGALFRISLTQLNVLFLKGKHRAVE